MKQKIKYYIFPLFLSSIITFIIDINMGGISLIMAQKKIAKAIIYAAPPLNDGYSVQLKLVGMPTYNRNFGDLTWREMVKANLKYGDSVNVYYDIKKPERFCVAIPNYKISIIIDTIGVFIIFFFVSLFAQTILIFLYESFIDKKKRIDN